MRRKPLILGIATFLLLVGIVVTILAGLLLREPNFYERAAMPPGPERKKLSADFGNQFFAFLKNVQTQQKWGGEFTEEQVNSYLAEDFVNSNADKQILPKGITDPRFCFEDDHLRLAFRYHVGSWSSIVSIEMGVWLAKDAPNVIALELRGMKAGALPISAQSLLERLTEAADSNGVKIAWYRHDGNPVAVLQFQGDKPRTTVVVKQLKIEAGKLSVGGESREALPVTIQP
jgi:hypothetical protein